MFIIENVFDKTRAKTKILFLFNAENIERLTNWYKPKGLDDMVIHFNI